MLNQDDPAASVCPFLGLLDDPDSHFSFADLAHRCHARDKPKPIDLSFQAAACLGGKYELCRRFRTAERPIPAWHPAATIGPTTVPGTTSDTRRLRLRGAIATAIVAGTGAAVLVLLVGVGLSRSPGTSTNFSPAAQALITTTTGPTAPAPILTASPTSSPSPTPTSAPSPTATAAPTPTPAPSPLIHVVQRGETLRYIAKLYGVTVHDIVVANGIEDRSRIYIGQELIIPTE